MFYDLINTYFEDRKAKSEMAKFGKSKEKRSDAKIIALAAVINAEGFLKHSRIHQGNISDSKTLNFKTPLICSGGLFTFWVNTSLYEKVAGNDVVKFNR